MSKLPGVVPTETLALEAFTVLCSPDLAIIPATIPFPSPCPPFPPCPPCDVPLLHLDEQSVVRRDARYRLLLE